MYIYVYTHVKAYNIHMKGVSFKRKKAIKSKRARAHAKG